MKKWFLPLLLLISVSSLSAQSFPEKRGAVNDFANVIEPQYEQRIEQLAIELWEKAQTALVVVTIESVPGDAFEDYAVRLYETWGIGQKGEDKGVLVLNVTDIRKLRIEVGYGLEHLINDARAGDIIRQDMVPLFSQGNFGAGFLQASQRIASLVAQDQGIELTGQSPQNVSTTPQRGRDSGSPFGGLCSIIAVILFFLAFGGRGLFPLLLFSFLGGGFRGHSGFGGGFGSGGFGGGFGGGGGGGFGGFGGGMSGGGGASGGY